MGVTPFYKWFEHDGVRGPNMATVYSDRGQGVRAAGGVLQPLQRGRRHAQARRLRLGGHLRRRRALVPLAAASSPPCRETTSELIIEGMQAAKAAGAINSFDLNYRAKLWAPCGGPERGPAGASRRIVSNVDVLIGNEEDLQKGLGIAGPGGGRPSRSSTRTRSSSMIEQVVEQFPTSRWWPPRCARSTRPTATTGRPCSGSTARRYVSPTCQLDVHRPHRRRRRLRGRPDLRPARRRSPEEALRLGWAHGALLTTFPGDTTMATLEQVEAFAKGGSARVQR